MMCQIKIFNRNVAFIPILILVSFTKVGITKNYTPVGDIVSSDTMKIKFNFWKVNLHCSIPTRDSSVIFTSMFLPAAAKSYKRVSLLSDFTANETQYNVNSGVQLYYDQTIDSYNSASLFDLKDLIIAGLTSNRPSYIQPYVLDSILSRSEKEILYSVWRSKVVYAENETELSELIRLSTQEMINNGYTDLGTDLLPFISVLMQEQHVYHYDSRRMLTFSPISNRIVTVTEMLSAMASLDVKERAGVCRDTHESGLRVARSLYNEYLKYKYPDKNYNADDYVFLQAWVTPPSHHVTIVIVDPENPRNLYELDWGRVYKKTDQEGPTIGNSIGTTIRLWRFDEKKNITVSFDLIKTQWGLLFDKEILPEKEYTSINGIYSPLYGNFGKYIKNIGERGSLSFTEGIFNAYQPFFLTSLSRTSRNFPVFHLFRFKGIMGIQTMILEDAKRKNYTLPWADWKSTLNSFNVIRYMGIFNTRKFKLHENISLNFFLNSQLDIFLSLGYYRVKNGGELSGFHSNGDGNVWFSYGTELSYENSLGTILSGIRLMQRNYLMPNDVRYLSPNPASLFGHISIVNNASDLELFMLLRKNGCETKTEFAFEQNLLKAQFVKFEFNQYISFGKKCGINLKTMCFKQIKGVEYFWYPKRNEFLEIGIQNKQRNWYLGINSRFIKDDYPAFGLYTRKTF